MTDSQNPSPNEFGDLTPLPGRKAPVFATGDVFSDRFRIVRRLASGGVGHVYEAVNVWTTRRVALKLLRPERAHDGLLARRFQREAEAATRVAHPNVVAVIDMGRDAHTGALYLVQEFLEGEDLHAVLAARGRVPPEEGMSLLAPVMRALQAAHEKGVLHRDLKPENIFLARSEGEAPVPKVIDFGLARLLSGSLRLTDDGTVNGTPSYMSPEQIAGEPDLDARTDIWSIAVIWYELLTDQLPFPQPRIETLFRSVLNDEPAPIRAVAPEVPAALADAVHRGLAKDRSHRFASMADFLAALTTALDPPAAPAPGPTVAPAPGNLRLFAGLVVASLLVLASLAWRASRDRDGPTTHTPLALQAARPTTRTPRVVVVEPAPIPPVVPTEPATPAEPVAMPPEPVAGPEPSPRRRSGVRGRNTDAEWAPGSPRTRGLATW